MGNGSKKNRLTATRRREVVAKLLIRDGPQCFWCQEEFDEAWVPTIDHITPIAEGGGNEQENLVLACTWCNEKRGTKSANRYICWLSAHYVPKERRKTRRLH